MKRTLIALGAGLTVFAGVFAMAASLGGITSSRVGADNTAVASCDTDGVTTAYATAVLSAPTRLLVIPPRLAAIANTPANTVKPAPRAIRVLFMEGVLLRIRFRCGLEARPLR